MYVFLIIVHVIVCLVLILVVLLQAGRGGGFSDMLGGGQPQSLFGTQTNAFMLRATEVCAVVFIITSLSLAILSTHRSKSLLTNQRLIEDIKSKMPALPATPVAPSATPTTETPATGTILPPAVLPATDATTPAKANAS
jgi:preprotein translocase subunit SecG